MTMPLPLSPGKACFRSEAASRLHCSPASVVGTNLDSFERLNLNEVDLKASCDLLCHAQVPAAASCHLGRRASGARHGKQGGASSAGCTACQCLSSKCCSPHECIAVLQYVPYYVQCCAMLCYVRVRHAQFMAGSAVCLHVQVRIPESSLPFPFLAKGIHPWV